MISTTDEPRLHISENFWISRGEPEDLECPPSGKVLSAKYRNGDSMAVEFFEVASAEALAERYQGARTTEWGLEFPLTAVEVQATVAGTGIKFGPREPDRRSHDDQLFREWGPGWPPGELIAASC